MTSNRKYISCRIKPSKKIEIPIYSYAGYYVVRFPRMRPGREILKKNMLKLTEVGSGKVIFSLDENEQKRSSHVLRMGS